MTNYAHLRVSTDEQDINSQRHGLLEYCNTNKITDLVFIEDTVTSRKKWRDRKIGELVNTTMREGDTLVVSEVSRMARSTLQVLEILEICAENKQTVHIVKQNLVFGERQDMTSRIMATVLGMAAEIERDFISMRTTEALAAKKAAGVQLGRRKGPAAEVKLDKRKTEILMLLDKGVNRRSIAKIVDCAPSTLYDWFKRHKISLKKSA